MTARGPRAHRCASRVAVNERKAIDDGVLWGSRQRGIAGLRYCGTAVQVTPMVNGLRIAEDGRTFLVRRAACGLMRASVLVSHW
jgi:hypothetical protein